MKLEGKTALISGASRNIGKQIALTFADEGADIIVISHSNPGELEDVAALCREKGRKAHAIQGDVSDSKQVNAMVKEATETIGGIDILVNNAGVRPHTPIVDITDEEWHWGMGVNLNAAFYMIRAVLPGMMERQYGSIMAMGGKGAITAKPSTSTVAASKHGLLGLIRAVAAEVGPYNIRANLINPGSIATERRNPEWYKDRKNARGSKEHLELIPLRRRGEVEDIDNACLYFASEDSAYVTGTSINVMGGEVIL
jgi:3-oxoacyl-[acyl-carrier protein] reductase